MSNKLDFSWLFGKQQPMHGGPPVSGDKPEGSGSDEDGSRGERKWTGFDPTGLERAAAAVRDLEKSPHAKDALEMAKMQEKTTQMKHQQKLKETEATIANLQLQHIQTQEDEKRKTLSSETYEHQKVSLEFFQINQTLYSPENKLSLTVMSMYGVLLCLTIISDT
jgi:ATPase family AAA domain-containing protein 3A/B